jgi:uncharacterized protein (TIGR02597 family)
MTSPSSSIAASFPAHPQHTEKLPDIHRIILASKMPQSTIATASHHRTHMIRSLLLTAAALGSVALGQFATAQTTVATDPVGFTTQQCLANSDTLIGVPFTRPPEFVGAVQSISGGTLTFSGTPFTTNQFVYAAGSQPKTYFALLGPHSSSNPKEGSFYTITSNGTNSVTVDLEGEDISAVQAGTQVQVIPYHTLGSLFPASDAGVSFSVSSNQAVRQTEILIPNYGGTGINLAPAETYFYLGGATPGWRRFGESGLPIRNDQPLVNAGYFILRNKATATTFTPTGAVLMKKAAVPLITRAGAASLKQDNYVSLIRPVDVQLNDLGLISSGAFAASSNQAVRVDELLVYNNAATGINKSPAATYYYRAGAWRKFGADSVDAGTDVIPTGAAFIIRKGGTPNGTTAFWTNAPKY